jgi:SAM-dependent methyltransferase
MSPSLRNRLRFARVRLLSPVTRLYISATPNGSSIPPKWMDFVGGTDYDAVGKTWAERLIDRGGLQPGDRVLDIGCGSGRIARALTGYLEDGRYSGFDIVPSGVRWARSRITRHHPNFTFAVSDVRNGLYNPNGHSDAANYRFPYDADSFDFAFATSVFTHMHPDETANYLQEVARVLRPSGRFLASLFVLNEASRSAIAGGASARGFEQSCLEEAAAIDEHDLRAWCSKAGLTVLELDRGSWSGSEADHSQDILLASSAE